MCSVLHLLLSCAFFAQELPDDPIETSQQDGADGEEEEDKAVGEDRHMSSCMSWCFHESWYNAV